MVSPAWQNGCTADSEGSRNVWTIMLSFKYLRDWIFPLPLRFVVALMRNAFCEWSSHSELWNISIGAPCLPKNLELPPNCFLASFLPSGEAKQPSTWSLWIMTIFHIDVAPPVSLPNFWCPTAFCLFSESRVRNSSFFQIWRSRCAV